MVAPRRLRVERMGRVPYGPMLALQEQRHAEVLAQTADETLFLLEHAPVITAGRNADAGHVRADAAELARRQVDFHATGRGGDVTFHGPGQIVGYPILALTGAEQDIRAYVGKLEEVLIRTAADWGVAATRVAGLRGIWVGQAKLAAIGVRVARWVTLHGFALNVGADLSGFDLIVPCGLADKSVTSLARERGTAPALAEVEARLAWHTAAVFERPAYAAPPTPLPAGAPVAAGTASEKAGLHDGLCADQRAAPGRWARTWR